MESKYWFEVSKMKPSSRRSRWIYGMHNLELGWGSCGSLKMLQAAKLESTDANGNRPTLKCRINRCSQKNFRVLKIPLDNFTDNTGINRRSNVGLTGVYKISRQWKEHAGMHRRIELKPRRFNRRSRQNFRSKSTKMHRRLAKVDVGLTGAREAGTDPFRSLFRGNFW